MINIQPDFFIAEPQYFDIQAVDHLRADFVIRFSLNGLVMLTVDFNHQLVAWCIEVGNIETDAELSVEFNIEEPMVSQYLP